MNINTVLTDLGIVGSFGSRVKSIQKGSSAFQTNDVTRLVPISEINPNASVVLVNTNFSAQLTSVGNTSVLAEITSSDEITLSRGISQVSSIFVNWDVFEFVNVKTKQTGYATAPGNINISRVNPQKSILFTSFKSESANTYINRLVLGSYFVDENTININFANDISATAYWQLLEFK